MGVRRSIDSNKQDFTMNQMLQQIENWPERASPAMIGPSTGQVFPGFTPNSPTGAVLLNLKNVKEQNYDPSSSLSTHEQLASALTQASVLGIDGAPVVRFEYLSVSMEQLPQEITDQKGSYITIPSSINIKNLEKLLNVVLPKCPPSQPWKPRV